MDGLDLDDVRAFINEVEKIVNENVLDDVMRYSHLKAMVEFRIIEKNMIQYAEMHI